MRFVASPILVAVAFGFLGPAALDAEDDDLEELTSDAAAADPDLQLEADASISSASR
ncbi:MAG: hypothetical protein Q8P18_07945 [Pseudomonadota bacterium]|nr:hypothetical protein [Pseudomonadota bacterium]